MKNLRDYTLDELRGLVEGYGEKPYRAGQLFEWVFKKGARSIDSMTDVSKAFRETLNRDFRIADLEIVDVRTSADGTRKLLLRLDDGCLIETVLIPEGERLTLCVSSQAGCALGCLFCETARGGLERDLTLGELAGQFFAASDVLEGERRITNVVLMGMGEPLLNYYNVVRFLGVLTHPRAMNLSHNRVTVSTSGVAPGIEKLGRDTDVNLAVSLNATTDDVRSTLMPINRSYPLEKLLEALRSYPLKGKKFITIEYVLISGMNDSPEDAERLVRLLKGIRCKVNLIPLNPGSAPGLDPPSPETVNAFHRRLMDRGVTVIVRAGKGADIEAACGQLRGAHSGRPARPEARPGAKNS